MTHPICSRCFEPIVGEVSRLYGSNYCLKCFQERTGQMTAPELSASQREARAQEAREAQRAAAEAEQQAIQSLILTTAQSIDGYRVVETREIVTAECAFGMNIFRDFFAAITDVVGGRSGSTQSVLRDARKTVLAELKQEAHRAGANAVIAVDLDYSEFSGAGKSMLFVVASGTAVRIAPISSH